MTSDEDLIEDIASTFYQDLVDLKPCLVLDLNCANFEKTCYDANDLLMKNNLFLRIYELKEKFRYVSHDNPKKNKIVRQVSSCIKKNLMALT